MNENTQKDETNQRVTEYLENLGDLKKLRQQFFLSDVVENELTRRRQLRWRAKKLLKEYREMNDEEQKEFEERRNKENKYTKEQLEEIAEKDNDELIPKEKLEELDIPARYVSGDMEARSVSEVRKIVSALMTNYDPIGKEAPNWSQTRRSLDQDHDIQIYPKKLKRYWTAIEEKEAFNLVKEKIEWQILGDLEETVSGLMEHVRSSCHISHLLSQYEPGRVP